MALSGKKNGIIGSDELVEIMPIHEIFAQGRVVELIPPNVRVTFWSVRGGEKVVVAVLVLPAEAFKPSVAELIMAAEAAEHATQAGIEDADGPLLN